MKKKTYILTFLMMLCSFAFGQKYHWEEQPKGWDASMVVYGKVTINGVAPAADLDLELGAFCGNELRGREKVNLINNRIELVIAGSEGNAITFKLYDNTNKEFLDYECSTVLSFVGNEIVKGQTINFTSKNHWNPAYNTNSNMTVTAKVTIDGANVNGDYEIGAFIGDEVCGSARVDANSIAYIVVSKDVEFDSDGNAINTANEVTFKLWNHGATPAGLTSEITDVTVDYVNNADHGSQSPFVINFNEAVAKVGDKNFATLQAAFDAVKDGETITLIDNVTVSVATAAYNDGTYIDGVRYIGDKSFTVDFNGKTVTDDGCVNDYLIYINNKGEKASEITFTNGTIVSKNGCWSAVCVNSSAATQNVVLNLNGMNITNSNDAVYSGNPVVRVRNLATVNVNDKTVITSNGASYGVAANTDGSTLNINEGATIVQKNSGTTDGNSVFAAVGGKGVINIKGGTITSDKFGVHTMTTGTPVINISGGTITAPVALKSSTNGGNGELATINVTGGTINGTLETYTDNGKIVVYGGTFTVNPQDYCAEGYACIAENDKYTVYPNGGEIAYRAYITDNDNREAVGVDLKDVCAGKSLVVELYDAAGNLLTKTSKQGGVKAENYTCNIVLWGNPSSSWTTTINAELTVDNIPATIKLYVDGILVDTFENALGAGTNVDETADYIALDCVYKEAKIGNTYYTSLKEAFAAAEDGNTIIVLQNSELAESITNAKKVTLDLNGKTITGTDNETASFGLITNRSELTITGNGKITLKATNDRDWNAYSSVISNQPGGKLIVENGTIEHLGGTDMAYAIDNLTNGKGTYAETVVNGGTVKSTYRAIRQFLNGIEAQNILTVNGGTIEGANKSIWMQDPSKNANTGTLTVGENAVLNGDVYLFVTAGSTEWPVVVSIASAALKDGAQVLTGNVPETYVVKEVNGTWGVFGAVAKIENTSYQTLAEAFAAAETGATVTMIDNVELTSTVKVAGKTITLDLNGKTVSGTCDASQSSLVYVENNAGLTVVDNTEAKEGKLTFAQGSSNVGWTVDVKGAFTLESGTIELTGSWSIGYAVDVRPNSWGTEYTTATVFTMNGGNIVSSDGAVRVASSSAAAHKQVSASFLMNGGYIYAAYDGVFVQQSDAIYDVLSFTITNGTINSGLNPVRVYGPAATGYVKDKKCMNIEFLGGTLSYTGNEAREWVIDGILRVGGGSSIETILESGNITANVAFAQDNELPDGYAWAANNDGTFSAVSAVAKIGTTYYASLQAAADAAKNGDEIVVIKDHEITSCVIIEKDVTLNLNNKTVEYASTEAKPAFRVLGDVVVKGGTIETTNDQGNNYCFIVGQGETAGKLTIENGIYDASNGGTSAVSVTKGELDIRSGEFMSKQYAADDGSFNDWRYLINCNDTNFKNGTAKVAISGGIFHNWNPENNAAEGNNTNFCAEGYEAVEIETGVYFVMPKQQITQTTQLNKGWTWFSLYVNIDGENGLGMLQNQLESAVSIKNYNGFTQYGLITDTEYGWYGLLTSISVRDMYMIKVGEAQEISFTAYPLDPSEYTFTLNNGWTWIPYPSRTPMTLDVALANTPSEGDYIKSQDGYAEYADGEWRGSLMTLEPGRGYMYKNVSGAEKQLTYPSVANYRGVAPANITAASNLMVPNMSKYANNMNITAVVNIDGEELMTEDFEVAAFAGEELRGSARPIYIESIDRYMLFLTVYGEEAEELTFKCYDLNSGEELNIFADGKIVFEVDAIEGSIAQPRVLSRGALSIDETSASSFSVYPNPVNRDNAISFETTFDRVEVYNSLGVKVAEYANVDSIDGIETAGIYVIKAANSNVVRYSRVIVK